MRVELTTLALSASRSADWANGPTAATKIAKHQEDGKEKNTKGTKMVKDGED